MQRVLIVTCDVQSQEQQQQLDIARALLRDVIRADLVELYRLGEQTEQLRAWLTGQPARPALDAEPAVGYPAGAKG